MSGWSDLNRMPSHKTLDGFKRDESDEQRLNAMFAEVFKGGPGLEILTYLKSVTVNAVLSPGQVEPNALMHLEGQRYLVHLIDKRVEKGMRNGR